MSFLFCLQLSIFYDLRLSFSLPGILFSNYHDLSANMLFEKEVITACKQNDADDVPCEHTLHTSPDSPKTLALYKSCTYSLTHSHR